MKLRKATLLAVIMLLAIPLAGLAYLGAFTRLHADDFCIAASMAGMGFWSSVTFWYNTWAGRFMYLVSSHLLGPTGPTGAAIFPALVIAAWFGLLAWGFSPLLRRAQWPHPRLLAIVASAFSLLVLLSTAPNLFQSVFWRDGQINYSFPLVGLALLAGLVVHAWLEPVLPGWAYAALGFLIAAVSGGFAEIYDATQVALLGLAWVVVLVLARSANRRRLGWMLAAALLGAILALVVVVIAPGNQSRQNAVGQTADLARVLPLSLRYGAIFFRNFVVYNRWWALLVVSLPFLCAWWLQPASEAVRGKLSLSALWTQAWFRGVVLIPISAFFLAMAACAPSAYAMNSYPEDRSIFIPLALLVIAIVVGSSLLGSGLRRLGWLPAPEPRRWLAWGLPVVVLASILLASGWSTIHIARQVPGFQAYARSWDKRAAELIAGRTDGQTEITVYGLTNRFGIADLRVEPDYWVNRCMANYYGYANIYGK